MSKISINKLPIEVTKEIIEKATLYQGENQLICFKHSGLSKINSILAYAALQDIDVNEAKSIVHFSEAWQ